MISFFSCPLHPSAFHLFECNFLGTYWSHVSDFCINITMGSRSSIFQLFGRRKFFRRVISDKNFSLRIFYRAKGIFFSSVFTLRQELLTF